MPRARLACSLIAASALLTASVTRAAADPAFGALHWRLLGPFRAGLSTMAVGVPGARGTFYFGAADGGVWRSVDAGRTWEGLFQREAVASIGALAVAASDPQVIYVGTGQPEQRWDIAAGNGVYGSRDGGRTWSWLGLPESEHIGRILVDPRDARVLLVAALGHLFGPNPERGVFRSEDGGKTWQRVLFRDVDTGAVDLARDPASPDVVYASLWQARRYPWQGYHQPIIGPGSGIYRSRDGGRTWQALSKGLPTEPMGRIGLAVAAGTGGRRVYAAIGAKLGGVYRSDDAGDTWRRVNNDASLGSSYFARLIPDPHVADTVWAISRSLLRSRDGGASFQIVRGSPGGDDYHDLWIDPAAGGRMVLASDQGTAVTVDDGATWSSWYNQPTGQFYRLAADDRFPYWVYSGQQDSGTVGIASRSDYGQLTFRDWHPVGGDEREYDLPSPTDPDLIFGSGLGGRISRWDARTGQVTNVSPWPVSSYGADPRLVTYRTTWIQPLAISALAPHALYASAQVLFRSLDEGKTWERISGDLTGADPQVEAMIEANKPVPPSCQGDVPASRARACGFGVISTIVPSPRAADEVWVGTDDGLVQLTRDGGKSWQDVSPPNLPLWSRVAQLEVSPVDAGTAYAAIDRHRMDDVRPYLYRTHDFGKTWTLASGGLPPRGSVSVVRQDPVQPRLLYAGTAHGAFVSFDDGDHWQSLQLDLPITGVNDLLVHGADLLVATQGRALWSLDDIAPLRFVAAHGEPVAAALVPPVDAVRWPGNQNRDTPLPPDEPHAANPPAGAILDYVLPTAARAVTLEVLDAQGAVVHRESSSEAPARVPAEQYFADRWIAAPAALPTGAGPHRVVWDLRRSRPPAISYEYSIAAVPDADTVALPRGLMTLPGRYTVRLTVDGAVLEAPLTVVMDPRVSTPLADLQAQLAFANELRDELAAAVSLHREVERMAQRLVPATAAPGRRHREVAPVATGPAAALAQFTQDHDVDGIASTLATVATDVESADAAPTAPQRAVAAEYRRRLEGAQARWKALLAGPLEVK